MIINGFGGMTLTDFGLTIPKPNTTIWKDGTSNTGYTLNPVAALVSAPVLSSEGDSFCLSSATYDTGSYAMFVNLIWFVPIRGKTISFDFYTDNYASNSHVYAGITPNITHVMMGQWEPSQFIYYESQTVSAGDVKLVGSFTVPNWAVIGYLGLSCTTSARDYCFNNIRISS